MNPLQSKGGRPKHQPNLNQIVEKSYEYPRIQRGEAYESTEPINQILQKIVCIPCNPKEGGLNNPKNGLIERTPNLPGPFMGVIMNQPNPNPNIVQTTRRVVDPCIQKPNHEKWGCTFVVPAAASPKSRSRRRHSAPSSDVPAAACPRSVFQGDEQTTMMRMIRLSRRHRCRRR